jgi:uncharacterized glyoxalase superfamily protein PhnB
MTDTPAPTIWPALRYDDAAAAVRFLVDVCGFEATLVVPGADGDVVHAELAWPLGGRVMLGSTRHQEGVHLELPGPGAGSVYVVTDEPDELFARVSAAGADVAQGLRDEDYGSRGFTIRDPERNYWSFGTYRGA